MTLGRSRRFVQRWVYAYRDHGLDAVQGGTAPGRVRRITPGQEARFIERVRSGATSKDGVSALRGKQMRQILELEFGVPYSLNAVYAILPRNGFSCLSPRTPVRVLFQDEARFGQQGTLSTVWAPTGSRPSVIRQNGRKSIWVFAAVEPATGWSTAMTFRRANTGSMQDSSTKSARGSGRGSTSS